MDLYIGYQFNKSIPPSAHAEIALWCTCNNAALKDMGNYYEVVDSKDMVVYTVDSIKESIYQMKADAAYSGITIVMSDVEYYFGTSEESIAHFDHAVLTHSDNEPIGWKVYKDDIPCWVLFTKQQFDNIVAFATKLSDECFALECRLMAQVAEMDQEKFDDKEYMAKFLEESQALFDAIDKKYVVEG